MLRRGSNERESSYSTERSSLVMLSAAKHLARVGEFGKDSRCLLPCHAGRSEASRGPSRQTLRGVYPERSEWAQSDAV
jgi:hypothetical protein